MSAIPLFIILTCAGSWLGFANPILHLPPLALLLPAALTALALRTQRPRKAFLHGWILGSLGALGCMYWVALPIHNFGGLPWLMAIPCPLLLACYMGLYSGLFALGIRTMRGKLPWGLMALWAGGSWCLLEAVRGVMFTGFPWMVLSSAFSPWPFAIQGAALIGAYGLSGVFAGAASLLALGQGLSRQRVCAVLILALITGYGFISLDQPLESQGTANIMLVQGNIDQSLKWDESYRYATISRYDTLTRKGLEKAPADLVVWPETALPFYLQEPNSFSVKVRQSVRKAETPLLTGSPAYTYDRDSNSFLMRNRAYLLDGDGATQGTYDKRHLVPFGEYVPLSSFLPFLGKLVSGAGDFVPGSGSTPLVVGDMRLGVLICYETIFPQLAQDATAAGANILVNISNDAWFGRSSAPLQHLDLSVLRAVEQRRSIARGTNTGISAFIDPYGRVLAQGALFQAKAVRGPALPLVSQTTLYHRQNMNLALGLVLLLGFCATLALLKKTRTMRSLANGAGSGYEL